MDSRHHAMALLDEGLSASHVAEICGVSRQTVQKWKKRRKEEGPSGLLERSRAPREHPSAVSARVERLVLKARRKYREGPKKLRQYLLEQHPEERIPAASTIGLILTRHGLTERWPTRRRYKRTRPSSLTQARQPNDVWCIDFKGEFDVGGTLCYPLTVTDSFSRYVIATYIMTGTLAAPVQACLWRAFRRYGLPSVIRSDNGLPFVSTTATHGLTRVSVRWLRLGIQPERIEPGKPYQNGQHERFHKALKHRTANPPAKTLTAQQKRFDRYRVHYNEHRPHEALGMRRPAELYTPSERTCPDQIPLMEHPNVQRVHQVSRGGRMSFRNHDFKVSKALTGETVGITEIQDELYEVSYGPLALAHISFRGPEPRILIFR